MWFKIRFDVLDKYYYQHQTIKIFQRNFFSSIIFYSKLIFVHVYCLRNVLNLFNLCVPIFGYLTISGAPYLLITQTYESKFKYANSMRLHERIIPKSLNRIFQHFIFVPLDFNFFLQNFITYNDYFPLF